MGSIDSARALLAEGFAVVPVGFKKKRPEDPNTGHPLKDWQKLRIDDSNVDQWFNGRDQNIGVILGEPSGHLVDIDLDCSEAIELAPKYLPETRTFGRASKMASHWVYRLESSGETCQFKGPDKAMLVEFRSNGGQTVFPGSTHESGEEIKWTDSWVPITRMDHAVLERAVKALVEAVRAKRYGEPVSPPASKAAESQVSQTTIDEWAWPLHRKISRAIAWAKMAEPAISGKGGHAATMRAATGIACGFALDSENAYRIMRDHFQATPAWSEKELRHKVEDAIRAMVIPWGSKLTGSLDDGGDRKEKQAALTTPAVSASPFETASSVIDRWKTDGPLIHLATGIKTLDDRTGGGPVFGSRWYIQGAPDAWKTGLLIQLLHHWATQGVMVGLLAVDEEADDVVTRLAQRCGFSRFDCEKRDPRQLVRIQASLNNLGFIVFGVETTIEEAAAKLAEKAAAAGKRAVFALDSIQTVACLATRASKREPQAREVVNANVSAFRNVVTTHKFIGFATSEMNRGGYAFNPEARAQQGHLASAKESGSIEYSARVLLSLVGAMHPGNTPEEPERFRVEVQISKNKHGRAWKKPDDSFYLEPNVSSQTLSELGEELVKVERLQIESAKDREKAHKKVREETEGAKQDREQIKKAQAGIVAYLHRLPVGEKPTQTKLVEYVMGALSMRKEIIRQALGLLVTPLMPSEEVEQAKKEGRKPRMPCGCVKEEPAEKGISKLYSLVITNVPAELRPEGMKQAELPANAAEAGRIPF
jgi:KaiC/GvpD/RAD55 family RecA-like ATPase